MLIMLAVSMPICCAPMHCIRVICVLLFQCVCTKGKGLIDMQRLAERLLIQKSTKVEQAKDSTERSSVQNMLTIPVCVFGYAVQAEAVALALKDLQHALGHAMFKCSHIKCLSLSQLVKSRHAWLRTSVQGQHHALFGACSCTSR